MAVTFSVVIPCYNYAHVVERAIRSVFEQDGDGYDVTVIDDGSTDGSRGVLERCTGTYGARLRVLGQPNRGLSAVRNRGVGETLGEYLIFLDADDELMPGALSHFRRSIEEGGRPPLVIGGYLAVHPSGGQKLHGQPPLPAGREARFVRYLRGETRIMPSSAALRRDVLLAMPFEESVRTGEDVLMFANLLARHACSTIDRPLVRHHKHPNSLRHDVAEVERSKPRLPYLLFEHGALPPSLARYRAEFASRCALSLLHTYARAGLGWSALGEWRRALAYHPRVALRPGVLREVARVLRRLARNVGADG